MKMDSIIDFLGFITVKSFSVFLRFVPLRPALWMGRRMGDMVCCSNLKRRMIAYANLKAAFPEKSQKELKMIKQKLLKMLKMKNNLMIFGLEYKYVEKIIYDNKQPCGKRC